MASPTRRRFETFAEQAGNFVRRNQGAEFDRTPRPDILKPRQARVRQIVAPVPGLGGIIGLRTMDGKANLSAFGQPDSLDVTHPVRLRFEGPVPGLGIQQVEVPQEKLLMIDDPRQRRRESLRGLGRADQELLDVSDPRQTRREGTELFSVGRLSTKENAAKAFLGQIFSDLNSRRIFILLANSAWITRTFLKKAAALLGVMNELEERKVRDGEVGDLKKKDPKTGISFLEAREELIKLFDKSSDTLLRNTINFAGQTFSLDDLRLVFPRVAASNGIRLITRDIIVKNRKTGEIEVKEADNIGAVRGLTKKEPVSTFVIDFTETHIVTDADIMKDLSKQLRTLTTRGVSGLGEPVLAALAGLALVIIAFFTAIFASPILLQVAIISIIVFMVGIGLTPLLPFVFGTDPKPREPRTRADGTTDWPPFSPLEKALPFFAGFGLLVVGGLTINALA